MVGTSLWCPRLPSSQVAMQDSKQVFSLFLRSLIPPYILGSETWELERDLALFLLSLVFSRSLPLSLALSLSLSLSTTPTTSTTTTTTTGPFLRECRQPDTVLG